MPPDYDVALDLIEPDLSLVETPRIGKSEMQCRLERSAKTARRAYSYEPKGLRGGPRPQIFRSMNCDDRTHKRSHLRTSVAVSDTRRIEEVVKTRIRYYVLIAPK